MGDITLDWFFKMPGLLIVGGVMLILIALLIFIVTGSKKRAKNKEESEVSIKEENKEPVADVSKPLDAPVGAVPVTPVEPTVVEPVAPVASVEPAAVEPVAPAAPVVEPTIVEPVVPAAPVEPAVESTNSAIDLQGVQEIVPNQEPKPTEGNDLI